MNRLERFSALVAEGKFLFEARAFCSYVLFSGLISLFEANPQDPPLKVDGAFLRWKAEDLQQTIQERFRLNDTSPHLSESEFLSLHDKLDKVAGYLSRFPTPAFSVVSIPNDRMRTGANINRQSLTLAHSTGIVSPVIFDSDKLPTPGEFALAHYRASGKRSNGLPL